ncbi:hypothetical protein [Streptomyces hydrogenans]|uniref:hypothetical protein n=1 Tax=Streptomyces hydrogenans TaxID=1873719 RepID=UPI0036E29E9C
MSGFDAVGAAYTAHSGSARGRLRHDLVERPLLAELPECPARILDVGCGNGVRIFHHYLDDAWAPEPAVYQVALEVAWEASWHSPYQEMGHLVHAPSRRPERGSS